MKYFFLSVIFLSQFGQDADSQVLKGNIRSESGDPIPYATVYISEIRQGTTSNTKGDYEIRLPPGDYKVTYQSLGFQPVYVDVSIATGTIDKDVVLPQQYYEIPEVRVTASGEDPAYIIMRKVIGMAPYYLNNIQYYKAEVYLKGNLLINRIPKILQKNMSIQQGKNGEQIRLKKGDSFFMESYNEIEFTAPDKYFQRVISINSTFPEQGNEISPMSFIQASFYEPEIAEMAISPLSPAAFSHYNFKYLGISLQGEYVINKIRVTPKRKSQQLFEGTIFIIEDLWCLHSVDLVNENIAGKIRVQQLYVPVTEGIWMPVSHNFDVNIDIMGVEAEAFYGSSVKYLDVKPNKSLKKPETVTTNFTNSKPPDSLKTSKTEEQINRILSKDEINSRDMVKLSRLMEKKSEKSLSDTAKNKLEVSDNVIQKVDKDANKKDSLYWSQIRPIPLSDIEKSTLVERDSAREVSLAKRADKDSADVKTEPKEAKQRSMFMKTMRHIASGYTWRDTTGKSIGFDGLFDISNFSFNTVDGFVYGVDFHLGKDWKNRKLYIAPELKWAFSRQDLIWRINSFYSIQNKRYSQVYARAGRASVDFNTGGGINLFLNMNFSLLLRKNNLKLYESEYYTLGYLTNISPGLSLDFSSSYEKRGMLENTTDFSIFRPAVQYTPNQPANEYLLPGANSIYAIRDMNHAAFNAIVTWTPRERYRVAGLRKIPEGSDWPTFTLTWRHGINEFKELANPLKHYYMLRFEVSRVEDLGAFSEFRWRVRTGGFLNKNNVTFYDFYHINSQPLPLLLNNYEDAFRLPAFYSLSTPEFFVQGHTKYTTPYLLLKYLPFLSNTLMRENLSLSYFGSRHHDHYTEIGYAISEIFFVAEIGVYVGFENVKYKSAGVSLLLRLN
ncbi:MAG TPA: DUF5686 and carboxypeptidase regulatory-like domain-containing protein [Bacteroidales bacterium]|nr:DUF5686 and carboxypeptidase regulatory-like domain-containing protein [Bacteroidales bacterium]